MEEKYHAYQEKKMKTFASAKLEVRGGAARVWVACQPGATCRWRASDSSSCACIMALGQPHKRPQTRGLQGTEICSLPALTARNPKPRCWRGCAPSQASMRIPPASSQAPGVLEGGSITTVSAQSSHGPSLLCVSPLCVSSKDTCHWI